MNLKGKTALVLGAIKGLGREIALDLAGSGANVAVTYFDWETHLGALEAALGQSGADHLIVRVNLLETEEIQHLIQTIIEQFGRLDILINNIERGGWPVVHGSYLADQWDLEMETTLRAKRWVFDAAFPFLKTSGDGCVINISSIAGIVGRCGPARYMFNDGYATANRGIGLLTETWARLGAPEVRVNEIMLGLMATRHGEGTRGWGLLNDGQKQALLDHTLLGRTGKAEDVVKTVRFVLQDAPFMTGSVIRLDGGYVLGGDKTGPMPKGVL
ncbi:MAG: SDR family oxidoreductase [Deltaproteobacteria bacterium]|nr:SDR family oxidoreductase [Deltaproteobacteria bacterium]